MGAQTFNFNVLIVVFIIIDPMSNTYIYKLWKAIL